MCAKLLIIDDSHILRREVIKILETAGLFTSFCEADNGIDGFKLLMSEAPDVVLCDLEMPGMDGRPAQLARRAAGCAGHHADRP